MTLPTTFEAVIIIALIFVPGIIFGQLIRRSIAYFPEAVDARHFLAMGASGLFLHTLLFPVWTRYIMDWYLDGTLHEHWLAAYVWFLVVIFVLPVLAGFLISKLVETSRFDGVLDDVGMGYVDRTPSAWDFAVRDDRTKWITVHLKNGGVIGGWFGTGSFASLYSARKDIYLEEMWILDSDGNFLDPHVNTDGVWISHDEISHIVFQLGEDNGNKADPEGAARE